MKRAIVLSLLLGLASAALAADAPWPPLEKQLAGIRPGSALEALVRANQDFTLLRPGERADTLGMPPWLRVWWRKEHPGAKVYPRVLHEVLAWMLTHQDLRAAAAPAEEGAPPAPLSVAVGAEGNVSGTQSAPRSESDIRVNFLQPLQVLAASNDIESSGRLGTYSSSDGGATWARTSLPLTAPDTFQSDPAVDWTSDGAGWAAAIGIAGGALRLRMYRSTDAGLTWTLETTFSGAQTTADKEMVWADHAAGSPYRDRIYAVWHADAPVYVNRRTAAGTWLAAPLQVSGAETLGTGIGGDVKTNAAGDVFAFWPDTGADPSGNGSGNVFVAKSTSGGDSFAAPVKVATTYDAYDIGIPAMANRRALLYVSAGAYRAGARDEVYAAWTDLSGVAGCSVWSDAPDVDVTSPCTTRVWLSRSTDGGATWSTPQKVNEDGVLHDQFNQALAVDPVSGTLQVIYYQTGTGASRKKTDVFTQSSFDGGLTWTCPVKVTTAQTDETVSGADLGNQYGDYNGLTGVASTFLPSWTDRRLGGYEQIWSAPLATSPEPGAPAAGTIDVPGPNQIHLTWSAGSPAAAQYAVYRGLGDCISPPAFVQIATVAGTQYTDAVVSGGYTYAYVIGALDGNGCQVGPLSGCLSATATGGCLLPPAFAGIGSAVPSPSATCTIHLSWTAGTPGCAGPVAYNVYRGVTSGFTPSLANRLFSQVTGTSIDDAAGVAAGTRYYYVVRAVDLSDGLEDSNVVEASAVPQGPLVAQTFAETFEGSASGGGFDHEGWTHDGLGNIDWAWSNAYSYSPTHSWSSAEQSFVSERVLATPDFVPTASTAMTFRHTYHFEDAGSCYDGGVLDWSTDGGATWGAMPPGAITSGGYNGTVVTGWGNPLAGRPAWCGGAFGTLTPVTVNLGGFAGKTIRIRWHEGDDNSGLFNGGWYVDSVTITNASYYETCAAGAAGAKLFTLAPCRLVDTRNPAAPLGGPALAGGGAVRTFPLAGTCGVPTDARAVSVNVTVVNTATDGDLCLGPAGGGPVPTSAVNFRAGQVRGNNAVVKVSADGTAGIDVQNDGAGTTDLVVDVNGFFR